MIKEATALFAVNVTIAATGTLLIPPAQPVILLTPAAAARSRWHICSRGVIPACCSGCRYGLCMYSPGATTQRRDHPLRRALKIVVEAFWGLRRCDHNGGTERHLPPTESAAVACVYSFLVTMFIYRDYKWRELPLLVDRVVRTVGMVMIMIGFSVAFGYMMAIMQVPAKVTAFFLTISNDKYTFLLLVNVLLLVLGTFMDLAPMLLICTPIFLPVIKTFGIDPVHFGIIMILNLGIGLLTPPVGRSGSAAHRKVTWRRLAQPYFYVPILIGWGSSYFRTHPVLPASAGK